MTLLNELLHQKPEVPLYHYTRAAGLIGILQHRELWATSHQHLNDRQELKTAEAVFRSELDANTCLTHVEKDQFLRLVADMQKSSFIVSFSERRNLLSQWRSYCLGVDGYSLGFAPDNPLFNIVAKQKSFYLIRCEYKKSRQRALCRELISKFAGDYLNPTKFLDARREASHDVPNAFRAFFKRYNWTYLLRLVSASCKHNGFHEEREWRLVSQHPEGLEHGVEYREGRFGIVPYYKLPLTMLDQQAAVDRIVIGPTANRAAALESVRRILISRGFVGTEIRISQIPLRQ